MLPVGALLRRADTVEVIGAALAAAGAGWGHRRVAWLVGRAASTVRGWLRRFEARAGPLREGFTAVAVALAPAPVMPEPTGSGVGDAVAAILLAGREARSRWPELPLSVSAWQVAAAITSGRLLAPTLAMESINTSCLW
ncbi:MAG: helix-turn-helix domain-containing protein [Actinomycetes bacterium]